MAQLMRDGPVASAQRERLQNLFGGAARPAQFMTARVRREESREPTAEEIAAARQRGRENSAAVAGHGRGPHGRRREVPSDRAERQAEEDRQYAEQQAIQLKTFSNATGDVPVQRMLQNDAPEAWGDDAVIDPSATLVIRGGGMPHSINAQTIADRNPDVKKKKPTDPWPANLWTGISVVSATQHVEGKAAHVVFRVPDGLVIQQCNNDHHAELRTTGPLSSKALNDLIKAVKTTGTGDGTVAQL